MKRVLSLLFVFVCAFALFACEKGLTGSVVIVGTSTEPGPNFFGTFWGNNATNKDVRDLTFGYSTVSFQKETGSWELDKTVVKDFKVKENEDGSKTYTIEINQGLVWNDGKPVTAKDYVFSLLFSINPVLKKASPKASITTTGEIVGSKDYNDENKNPDGKAELPGVTLIDDYKFEITIGAENFPYYYEFSFYGVTPYPLHHIAPKADVVQGTKGAKITGEFNEDVLKKTVDNGKDKGYRYDIKVTCGPYNLYDYDPQSQTITLKKNPLFKGDYNGQLPNIDNIVIKYVQANLLIQALENGEINLIAQASGDEIVNGLKKVAEGKFSYTTFARNGYGLIAFHCDEPAGPTQFKEVRQAIAYLLNRELFLEQYTKGYGVLPHGEYGLSQWMVQESMDENGVVYGINEKGEKVALNPYEFNPAKAVELLEAAGYIYDENGNPYVQAEDGSSVRYRKKADGTLEKLEIPWGNTASNPVSDLIRAQLIPNAKKVGMAIKDVTMDFNTMLYTHYYGQHGDGYLTPTKDENGNWVLPEYQPKDANGNVLEEDKREYHMVNLGTGFNPGIFIPYYSVSIEYWGWDGGANFNYLYDEFLLKAAEDMLKASNKEEYLLAWQKYQYKFNELLPTLPLYSDLYHAFFSNSLKDYEVTADWDWTSAILYARVEK